MTSKTVPPPIPPSPGVGIGQLYERMIEVAYAGLKGGEELITAEAGVLMLTDIEKYPTLAEAVQEVRYRLAAYVSKMYDVDSSIRARTFTYYSLTDRDVRRGKMRRWPWSR